MHFQPYAVGWVAGSSIGVKFGAISVDVGAAYRYLMNPVTIESRATTALPKQSVPR